MSADHPFAAYHRAGGTARAEVAIATAPLTHYIQEAYHELDPADEEAPIFRDDLEHTVEPLLRCGFRNTIILAAGGYNPPHYGHAELLTHVLHHGGEDLNIIAAIMIPIDDTNLKRKFGIAENPIILPKSLRVSLCRNSPLIPNNVWVYDQPETEWHAFRSRLEASITSSGFTVDFMTVVGPDHIFIGSVHSPARWSCSETIVSDACRPADFVAGHHKNLVRITACTDWHRLKNPNLGKIRRLIEDKAARRFNDALVIGSVSHAEREQRAYVEESFCDAVLDLTIRFVPWTEGQRKPNVSSTDMRKLIVSCDATELGSTKGLAGKALCHEELVQWILRELPERAKMSAVPVKGESTAVHEW
ncbi:hypothetical protein HYQ45_000598 [Verticillium longisporum]|uniref:Cytidyltransferase-like domain-containing protein n=1 Tax=Verticillium longisporum TaxID=100787 RepID=A0A8I3A3W8_VERLO|nr:hypothetical protein HYQ45_000598 [Verticillium longisporum]